VVREENAFCLRVDILRLARMKVGSRCPNMTYGIRNLLVWSVEGLGGLSGGFIQKMRAHIRGHFLMIPFWELVSMFIVENIAK